MRLLLALSLLAISTTVSVVAKETAVKGHTRKDGTYVEPHRPNEPNKTETDNYSTKGNTNPNTGKKGTREAKK